MDEPVRREQHESVGGPVIGPAGSSRRVKLVRAAWTVATIVLVVVFAGLSADFVTSSPRVCGLCHEMRPKVTAWRTSPHADIACYSCHMPQEPWYRWPRAVMERGAVLGRDLRAHNSGRYEDPVGRDPSREPAIPDSVCGRCHDASRRPTPRLGILIDHAKHAKRNKSCVSCHFWTAHPNPGKSPATAMMERCFACHGLSKQAKAPGTCSLCHDKASELRPASHKTGDWRRIHPKVAEKDRRPCVMCHGQNACRDCHGLEIPHPYGWAQDKSGHAAVGAANPALCTKCHTGRPDFCSMCHHKGLDASKGPWVAQHFLMVRESGSALCMRCHEGRFCVDCHAKRPARIVNRTP